MTCACVYTYKNMWTCLCLRMKYNWRTTVDLYSTWPNRLRLSVGWDPHSSFGYVKWSSALFRANSYQAQLWHSEPACMPHGITASMIHGIGPLEGLNWPSSPVKITLTATRTSTTKKGWKSKAQVFSHSELNFSIPEPEGPRPLGWRWAHSSCDEPSLQNVIQTHPTKGKECFKAPRKSLPVNSQLVDVSTDRL